MPSKPGGDDRWDTPNSLSDRSVSGEIPPELVERVDQKEFTFLLCQALNGSPVSQMSQGILGHIGQKRVY
eukprot:6107475-Amphidinium_carterae.1